MATSSWIEEGMQHLMRMHARNDESQVAADAMRVDVELETAEDPYQWMVSDAEEVSEPGSHLHWEVPNVMTTGVVPGEVLGAGIAANTPISTLAFEEENRLQQINTMVRSAASVFRGDGTMIANLVQLTRKHGITAKTASVIAVGARIHKLLLNHQEGWVLAEQPASQLNVTVYDNTSYQQLFEAVGGWVFAWTGISPDIFRVMCYLHAPWGTLRYVLRDGLMPYNMFNVGLGGSLRLHVLVDDAARYAQLDLAPSLITYEHLLATHAWLCGYMPAELIEEGRKTAILTSYVYAPIDPAGNDGTFTVAEVTAAPELAASQAPAPPPQWGFKDGGADVQPFLDDPGNQVRFPVVKGAIPDLSVLSRIMGDEVVGVEVGNAIYTLHMVEGGREGREARAYTERIAMGDNVALDQYFGVGLAVAAALDEPPEPQRNQKRSVFGTVYSSLFAEPGLEHDGLMLLYAGLATMSVRGPVDIILGLENTVRKYRAMARRYHYMFQKRLFLSGRDLHAYPMHGADLARTLTPAWYPWAWPASGINRRNFLGGIECYAMPPSADYKHPYIGYGMYTPFDRRGRLYFSGAEGILSDPISRHALARYVLESGGSWAVQADRPCIQPVLDVQGRLVAYPFATMIHDSQSSQDYDRTGMVSDMIPDQLGLRFWRTNPVDIRRYVTTF